VVYLITKFIYFLRDFRSIIFRQHNKYGIIISFPIKKLSAFEVSLINDDLFKLSPRTKFDKRLSNHMREFAYVRNASFPFNSGSILIIPFGISNLAQQRIGQKANCAERTRLYRIQSFNTTLPLRWGCIYQKRNLNIFPNFFLVNRSEFFQ